VVLSQVDPCPASWEPHATKMIPIFKRELKIGEQGWRAVAAYCGYTVKHNPEKIHPVVTSELLEMTMIVEEFLRANDMSTLDDVDNEEAASLRTITDLVDDIQSALDLGGPPKALEKEIVTDVFYLVFSGVDRDAWN